MWQLYLLYCLSEEKKDELNTSYSHSMHELYNLLTVLLRRSNTLVSITCIE